MKSAPFTALLLLHFISCVSGEVEVENACTERHFLTVPAGATIPNNTLSFTTTHDFSNPVSKLAKFGKVSINIYSIALSTDERIALSFIKEVSVAFVKEDGSLEPLASSGAVGNSESVTFDVLKQSEEMQESVQKGPFRLKITGKASSPPESFTPFFRVCATLHANVASSVSDIK